MMTSLETLKTSFALDIKLFEESVSRDIGTEGFCSAETLEEGRKKAESEEKTPIHAGTCRAITSTEAARRVSQGEKGIIRFKTPENIDVSFHDLIRGNLRSITIEMEGCHEQKK